MANEKYPDMIGSEDTKQTRRMRQKHSDPKFLKADALDNDPDLNPQYVEPESDNEMLTPEKAAEIEANLHKRREAEEAIKQRLRDSTARAEEDRQRIAEEDASPDVIYPVPLGLQKEESDPEPPKKKVRKSTHPDKE